MCLIGHDYLRSRYRRVARSEKQKEITRVVEIAQSRGDKGWRGKANECWRRNVSIWISFPRATNLNDKPIPVVARFDVHARLSRGIGSRVAVKIAAVFIKTVIVRVALYRRWTVAGALVKPFENESICYQLWPWHAPSRTSNHPWTCNAFSASSTVTRVRPARWMDSSVVDFIVIGMPCCFRGCPTISIRIDWKRYRWNIYKTISKFFSFHWNWSCYCVVLSYYYYYYYYIELFFNFHIWEISFHFISCMFIAS